MSEEVLPPCPFCGVALVYRGDYNLEAARNWWQHPEDEDSETPKVCFLDDIEIPGLGFGGETAIELWRTRADLATPAQWQPIDSAPKDSNGEILLGFADPPQPTVEGYWSAALGCWVSSLSPLHSFQPTHWMKLPDPPVVPTKE